jgi:hypothetical protein
MAHLVGLTESIVLTRVIENAEKKEATIQRDQSREGKRT